MCGRSTLPGRRQASWPQIRHQRYNVLQVAVALWRNGDLRRPQTEGAGGREPQAEETAGRVDHGRGHSAEKTLLMGER
jgi:hypothetical protein